MIGSSESCQQRTHALQQMATYSITSSANCEYAWWNGQTERLRLGHPTLTQQHHLDALALRPWYLPAKRSSQPPHLGFAAFGHLFLPNQMAHSESHLPGRKQ